MRLKVRQKLFDARLLTQSSIEPDSKPPTNRKSPARKANRSATALFSSIRQSGLRTNEKWGKIPPHVRQELETWVCAPGHEISGFLEAVLMNDLYMCASRATDEEIRALPLICQWLESHAPRGSYGSPACLHTWLAEHRKLYRRRA